MSVLAVTGPDATPLNAHGGIVETATVWRGRDLLYPLRVARFLKRRRPHIVHVQFGPHGEVYGGMFGEPMLYLLLLLRAMGLKTTVTLHSTWMPDQVVGRVRGYRRLRILSPLGAPLFRLYMKLLDLGSTTVQLSTVKPDSLLRKRFLQEFGYAKAKVLEIPHPYRTDVGPLDRGDALRQLGLQDRRMILIFGFIRRGKGIDQAIRCVKQIVPKHPELVLLIAGTPIDEDGRAYLKEIRQLSDELGIRGNVHFDVQFIPEAMVPTYLSASYAVLIPYTESVGASGPMHSYAALERPFIVSDAGVHSREALGGHVVLFKSGNQADLAEKILWLLDNRTEADRIGAETRAYALHEGWDMGVKRTLVNYSKTLRIKDI